VTSSPSQRRDANEFGDLARIQSRRDWVKRSGSGLAPVDLEVVVGDTRPALVDRSTEVRRQISSSVINPNYK